MDLRDHINKYPYGQTWTMEYQGSTVTARKDYHSWTYRGGQLVTGICIPGITLFQPLANVVQASPSDALDSQALTPDPSLAVYGADDVPPGINWGLVLLSGAAAVLVVGGFVLMLRQAGRAA